MAYVYPNFKTKKQLKKAVAEGQIVCCSENTPAGPEPIENGEAVVEGPHYPELNNIY